jgi:hypothetical protein
LCLIFLGVPGPTPAQSSPPTNGYIPDEATAIRVAEAVLTPIYGEKHVLSERPFRARLDGEFWIVEGSLPKPPKRGDVVVGGTMVAEINRKTGCIRAVYHMR